MPEPVPEPFDPQHMCRACGAEGAPPVHHKQPILYAAGTAPQPACSGLGANSLVGEHLCNRCESCGYTWMERVSAGMTAPPG
jgi:hypothetical protein